MYRLIADTGGAFVQPALYEAFGLTVVEVSQLALLALTHDAAHQLQLHLITTCDFTSQDAVVAARDSNALLHDLQLRLAMYKVQRQSNSDVHSYCAYAQTCLQL